MKESSKFLTCIILTFCICPGYYLYGQDDTIPEYASFLSKYIQIPSEEKKEKTAGLFLFEQCKKKGLHTEVLVNEDTSFNFVASLYPLAENKPNIILLNHLDVVPPGDTSAWTFPPYSGHIDREMIWGRGAIDNKGLAVVQLYALSSFVEISRQKDLPFNISILSVSGEETGGLRGAKIICENYLQHLNPVLLIGEGGSGIKKLVKSDPEKKVFAISSVDKTKLTIQLELKLKSAGHGSSPSDEYAMKEMIVALEKLLAKKISINYNRQSAKAIKELGAYEKGISGFIQRNFTFFAFRPIVKREIKKNPMLLPFFTNTISVTRISTPNNALNQVAQQVQAVVDCRLIPGTSPKRYIKKIKKILSDKRISIGIIYNIYADTRSRDPYFYSLLTESIQKLYPQSVILDIVFPATTDNTYFRAKGIPAFGLFPSCFEEDELEGLHNVNEKISIQRLEEGITLFKTFIDVLINQEHLSPEK